MKPETTINNEATEVAQEAVDKKSEELIEYLLHVFSTTRTSYNSQRFRLTFEISADGTIYLLATSRAAEIIDTEL